jgi:hypothetical protein
MKEAEPMERESGEEAVRISGICERDIDLLLLEEFRSSPSFLQWFARQVSATDDWQPTRLVSAERSVTQVDGESDLEIRVEDNDGEIISLLIENKVNACLQPRQADRYRDRGRSYVERGQCVECLTVLVAPERYFGTSSGTKGFDARLTYEVIREWFLKNEELGARRFHKAALLGAAIGKGTPSYEEDQAVTGFWRAYWLMARDLAPELQMEEPLSKPAGAGFIHFNRTCLPKRREIVHKLNRCLYGPHDFVDLQFSGMGNRLSELQARFGSHLEPDMAIVQASKSGAVRIQVPRLDWTLEFSKQAGQARVGILAAKRLLAWYSKVTAAGD